MEETYKNKYLKLKEQYVKLTSENLDLKRQLHNLTVSKNMMSHSLDGYKLKNSNQEKLLLDIFNTVYNQTSNPKKVQRIKNILLGADYD